VPPEALRHALPVSADQAFGDRVLSGLPASPV
jgi:hypothetical protein